MSVPAEGDPVPPATPDSQTSTSPDEALVVEELLVEDVSIDGMCGVY
jgi:mycofactocin precursor